MSISYDSFTKLFLNKITEYKFLYMYDWIRQDIIDGYMKRAIVPFNSVCQYSLSNYDDEAREITTDIPIDAVDEIVDIVSDGMVVQWMKPMAFKEDNLENTLNTTDFTGYSPANILKQVQAVYEMLRDDYTARIREYSYVHGDLGDLHL